MQKNERYTKTRVQVGFEIDAYGNAIPGPEYENCHSAGNVYQDSLHNVWIQGKNWHEFRKGRNLINSKCSNCEILNICGGRNAKMAYDEYGTVNAPDGRCNLKELATAPLSVSLSITDLCNLRCKHCSKKEFAGEVGNLLDENDSMQVSIDNVYEGYLEIRYGGDFKLLSYNCEILNGATVNTTANMVVTADNVFAMVDVLNFCEKKRFKNIRLRHYSHVRKC